MKYWTYILVLITVMPLMIATTCDNSTPDGPSDAGAYHNYKEITDELNQMQIDYPKIAQVTELGKSIENRKILAIKISDNASIEENEPKILFVGGHHAREWISVDVPFLLAKYLLDNYSKNTNIRDMIDTKEIWIIPLLNPDGHQYTITNNRLWRKNRRNNGDGTFGVDINRNYGFHWGGPGSSGDTYSETYRGRQAFSEPESKIIRDLVNTHDFGAMISYHNFSQLVLYPWGYTNSPAPHKNLLDQIATLISDKIYNVHGKKYTPEQSSELYLASGDATDWLYGEANILSFTIELRPRSSNPGFILPEREIQPTFEENLPAALFLIERTQNVERLQIAQ